MQYSFLGFSVSKMMELNLDMKDMAILRYFVDFRETGKMKTEIIKGRSYYWVNYNSMVDEMPFLGLGKRAIMTRMLKLRDLKILNHYTKKEGGTFSFFELGSRYIELISSNKSKSKIKPQKITQDFMEIDQENTLESNKYTLEEREENTLENHKHTLEEREKNELRNHKHAVEEREENALRNRKDTLEEMEEDVEGVINNIQAVPKKGEGVAVKMYKGCLSKGRTKTHLLNNSSTIETNNKKYIKKEIQDIVKYLNDKLGTCYKYDSKKTIRIISSRLMEGYSFNDFKTVIEKKFSEWVGSEFERYLTPGTLFGEKFENYLNQRIFNKVTKVKTDYELPKLRFNNFEGRDYDYDVLEKKLLGWE